MAAMTARRHRRLLWGFLTSDRLQSLPMRCWGHADPSSLVGASTLHLDRNLTGRADTTSLPLTTALRLSQGLGPRIICEERQPSTGQEGWPPKEMPYIWQHYNSDPGEWWYNRPRKPSPRYHDFRHKPSKVTLSLYNRQKPARVDKQLANWDTKITRPAESAASTTVQSHGAFGTPGAHDRGQSEIGMRRKLCEDGRIVDAVDALNLVVQRGYNVDKNLIYRVLKRCIAHKDLELGRRVHAVANKSGYEGDAFLATQLIGLYASHQRLEDAMRVFTNVSTPSSYNWATIIFAYARHGEAAKAIRLYRQMRESTSTKPTDRIYVAVLKACTVAGDLLTGKEVHARVCSSPGKPNIFVQTGLVSMYANCGSLGDAHKVFDNLPDKDVVTWTAMIAGFAQQGMGEEALSLYKSMQQEGLTPPDSVTFASLFKACASVGVGAVDQGKQLHAHIEEQGLQADVVLGTCLVDLYVKCGSLDDARSIFDRLPDRDVVAWTTMIAGYAQQGMGQEALRLYNRMQQEGVPPPSSVTYGCLLQACAIVGAGALHEGKQLHAQIEERGLQGDVVLGTCLVDMYSKCGSLEDARGTFDRLRDRDVVTWNTMLAGYALQGFGEEAISLYRGMEQEGDTHPNSVTFVCLLQACASIASLPLEKQLHSQIEDRELQVDVGLGAALVNMYAKCGSMLDSQRVFDSMSERTLEAWNGLTCGYARQGDSEVVFDLVEKMKLEGIQPDGITFLSLLTVCSHVGLVEKGRKLLKAMSADYGLIPSVEHYTCMIDLLGRAGLLEDALRMAKSMPLPPNALVWQTLLGACRKWNNVKIGEQAFELAVSVDGKVAAPYVLMSNIYASAKMWEEAKEMQARRVKSGAWKEAGQSWWTDMGGLVHTFVVGD